MGTTAEKLAYLADTKTDIKNAIAAKGVNVPDGATFRQYANLISGISTGLSDEELAKATAAPEDVAAGKTFYAGDRTLKTGAAEKGFVLTHEFVGTIKNGESKTFTTNSKNAILFGAYSREGARYSFYIYIKNGKIISRFYFNDFNFSFSASGSGLNITFTCTANFLEFKTASPNQSVLNTPLYIFEG